MFSTILASASWRTQTNPSSDGDGDDDGDDGGGITMVVKTMMTIINI